jgi:hypothetical protein
VGGIEARPAAVLLAGLLAVSPVAGAPRPFTVWAAGDGTRVRADDTAHPGRHGNSAWDGETVRLFSARNETVAFQLFVEAGEKPLTVRSVSLVWSRTGPRHEAFSEHYLDLTAPTPDDEHGGWFWYRAAAPAFTPGPVPDALVPLSARPGCGGFPLPVPSGRLQGFWFDVEVPSIPPVAPGGVRGKLAVATDRGTVAVPVALEVLDLTLPDDDPVKTMVYMSDVGRRHGHDDPALRHAYRLMAHRHRFDTAEGVGLEELPAFRKYLTGEAFTRANGYDGPGQGRGLAVFGVGFYGAVSDSETKAVLWRKFDDYAKWFSVNAPGVLPFIYLTDEPGPQMFPWVREKSAWIRENPGPGGKLPVFLTKNPRPELEGAVDIWATVADQVDLERLPAELKKGRRWWFYNGMRPMSGAVTIDAPATDFRVQPWICFLNGVELWFCWESTHWRHNHQGPRAGRDQDVWKDPVTFTTGDVNANGDGTLFYPGEDACFPAQDRGVPGPISSIRMKNLRRGQQDIAYLRLALDRGMKTAAMKLAKGLVPRAFRAAKSGEPASWPADGDAFEEVRARLARLARGRPLEE